MVQYLLGIYAVAIYVITAAPIRRSGDWLVIYKR